METPKVIYHNGMEFRLVPFMGLERHPYTERALYVNNGEKEYAALLTTPDGDMKNANIKYGTYITIGNSWKSGMSVFFHRAVYLAWSGQKIPDGYTIDHINGDKHDNRLSNLRCVSTFINTQDGATMKKTRNVGINLSSEEPDVILRYYRRMAELKIGMSIARYSRMNKEDLLHVLHDDVRAYVELRRILIQPVRRRKLSQC